jgi:tetratricopeptide (TPR) repeat protein
MSDAEALQSARRLFDTEAEVLYALGIHDQIPRLHAHFAEAQDFFLVQEFIDGEVLSREIKRQSQLCETDVVELLLDVLGILEFVHQQQVIHRDIKPSNLIRRRSDRHLVLIDFGAVKQIEFQAAESSQDETITIAVGSSGYMPNEQLAGKPRFSSDIYALGMLAIQCLTGVNPKKLPEDPRTSEILWRDRAQASPELSEILDKMVRYDFRQRYPSAKEALEAMQSLCGMTTSQSASGIHLNSSGTDSEAYLAWLERGDDLFNQQRYRDAITAYDRVLQTQPQNYVAWFKQAIAYENLHDYTAAVAAYDRTIALQPEDYLAWYKRSNVLEKLQRYADALSSLDQVVAIQPDNYWAWHDRGRVLENLQQTDEAIAAYDRAVQLKPDFQLAIDSRKDILTRLKQADVLYHLQHYDEAITACDRALQANPKDALAWFMRGMALENLKRHDEAVTAYREVVTLQPDDHVAWFKLATALELLGCIPPAIDAYHRVVQLQPSNYWAWYDRGKLLEQQARYDEAISCYDRTVQLKPDFQSAVQGRLRLLGQMTSQTSTTPSDEQADETLMSSISDLSTTSPMARSATLINTPTDPATAIASSSTESTCVHSAAAPLSTPTTPSLPKLSSTAKGTDSSSAHIKYQAWIQRGKDLEKLRRYKEAFTAYEQARQFCSKDATLWQCRGSLFCHLGRYQDAVASYKQAIRLQPDDAELWNQLGTSLAHLKKIKEALTCFERSLSLNANSYTSWYGRGRMLFELQHYSEAQQCFQQSINLKPDFQPALRDYQRYLAPMSNQAV